MRAARDAGEPDMSTTTISDIDLNLLKVLDALLRDQSVTRAAERLGIGQPAASHALGRLRKLFQDPLFVRAGRGILPTPRAELLRQPITRLLREVGAMVRHEPEFDPEHTNRTFTLICPDVVGPTLGMIAARLHEAAPAAHLVTRIRSPTDALALERGDADLALVPKPPHGPGLVCRGLGALTFGVHLDVDHPTLGARRRLSRRAWITHPHVVAETGHGGSSLVAGAIAREAMQRHVGLIVPGFLAALTALRGTTLTYTAPQELTAGLLEPLALRVLAPPIELPGIPICALWHERFTSDAAHRFFRAIVIEEIEAMITRGRGRGRA